MGGLAAISEANGWLMALVGITVVFSGLASLCVFIYLFPRLLAWWGELRQLSWQDYWRQRSQRHPSGAAAADDQLDTSDIEDVEAALRLLTTRLGEPFSLPRLLDLASKLGVDRPHSAVNRLILKGTLKGGPDGWYRWENKGTS